MKVQRQFVNKRGNKSYYKYVLVIPPGAIEESGFKEGEELIAEAKKGEIKLKRK